MSNNYTIYQNDQDDVPVGTFSLQTIRNSSFTGESLLTKDFSYHSYQLIPTAGTHDGTFYIEVSNDQENWTSYYQEPYSSSSNISYFYGCSASLDSSKTIMMAIVTRSAGNPGDTDYDNDFFYTCVGGTDWGKIPLVSTSFFQAGSPGDTFCSEDYYYVYTAVGWKQAPMVTSITVSQVGNEETYVSCSKEFYFKYSRIIIEAKTIGNYLINEIHGRF